jgi:hypothetical protein
MPMEEGPAPGSVLSYDGVGAASQQLKEQPSPPIADFSIFRNGKPPFVSHQASAPAWALCSLHPLVPAPGRESRPSGAMWYASLNSMFTYVVRSAQLRSTLRELRSRDRVHASMPY